MNSKELLESVKNSYAKGVVIMEGKNHDYSKATDGFSNFRKISNATGLTVPQVIMVFVFNKLFRIDNLFDKENLVLDEKKEDTLIDCCNYLAIMKAYLESEKH